MRRFTLLLLIAALAIPRPCRADDDDQPHSIAMVDGGVAMIIFGAIGTAIFSLALPLVLQAPSDGCCGGLRDDNRGAFIGVMTGLGVSAGTLMGGIPLVYFGAKHKGHPNAVITASGISFRW